MKRVGPLFFFAFFALLAALGNAYAQGIPPYQIDPDGRDYEILLGPEQRDVKELSLFFVSRGNVSTAVDVKVSAPVGARVTARGGLLRTGTPLAALSSSNLIQAYRLRTTQSPKREIPEARLVASSEFGGGGFVHAWYHLQKDACSGGKSSEYVTEVKLDLRGISPTEYDNAFSVRMAIKEFAFQGDKVATIKPASDGKYRNEPILLMQSIAYGGEYVNIVDWANGRIRAQRRIPIVKYVGYKGYGLSLARLRGHLTGGRSTFELSNTGDIYGVCFNKVRARQVANGYPAPN